MFKNTKNNKQKLQEESNRIQYMKDYEKTINEFNSFRIFSFSFSQELDAEIRNAIRNLKSTFLTINKYMWETPDSNIEFTIKQIISMMDIVLLAKYGERCLKSIDATISSSSSYYRDESVALYDNAKETIEQALKLAPACKIAIDYTLDTIKNQYIRR